MEEDIKILKEKISKDYKDMMSVINSTSLPLFVEDTIEDMYILIKHLTARNKELEEYANWHIEHLSEDIADYIDDDKIKNISIIGELKEEREHWQDIKRILKNEKTYIDYKNF